MSFSVKLLSAVFALLFTVVSVLWILGGKKVRCSTSLLIAAPPANVFPYLHEEDLCKQWVTGLVDVTPMGTEEKVVGSRAVVTVELKNGKSAEYENEIIRYEEFEYFSTRGSDGLSSKTAIFKLESKDDNNTYLTYRVRTAAHGFGKLLAPFRNSLTQEDVDVEAARLKSLIESQYVPSETPASPPTESETQASAPAAAGGM